MNIKIYPPDDCFTRPLPMSTIGCNLTATVEPFEMPEVCKDYENQGFIEFYHVSYSYLGTIAFVTTLLVAHLFCLFGFIRYPMFACFKTTSPKLGTTWFNRIPKESHPKTELEKSDL